MRNILPEIIFEQQHPNYFSQKASKIDKKHFSFRKDLLKKQEQWQKFCLRDLFVGKMRAVRENAVS